MQLRFSTVLSDHQFCWRFLQQHQFAATLPYCLYLTCMMSQVLRYKYFSSHLSVSDGK